MEQTKSESQFYAETYDICVSDWTGEIDFCREVVDQEVKSRKGSVLELACGTGRIAIRLAQNGVSVVGLDRSQEMLEVARQKSVDNKHMRWVEGDMRSFELDERFNMILIPSHSFQNLNSPEDQVACLECSMRHLKPGGMLLVHLDHMNDGNMSWLGELTGEKKGVFEAAEQFKHPRTGYQVQTRRAWSYEPATQTAIMQTVWEEIGTGGEIISRWDTGPIRLHCVFRFEMEHLLKRVGFDIEHVYGDFFRQELRDDSTEMIWIARKGENSPQVTK
jgi:ubiquinone/menaquinone biosynthesis C-methylase UbiE